MLCVLILGSLILLGIPIFTLICQMRLTLTPSAISLSYEIGPFTELFKQILPREYLTHIAVGTFSQEHHPEKGDIKLPHQIRLMSPQTKILLGVEPNYVRLFPPEIELTAAETNWLTEVLSTWLDLPVEESHQSAHSELQALLLRNRNQDK